jgi:hypothetical protein
MRRETKHTGNFVATDGSGRKHELHIWQGFRYSKDLSGSESVTRGLPVIKTQDGMTVNPHGGGKYEVIATGLILHSNDPNAL